MGVPASAQHVPVTDFARDEYGISAASPLAMVNYGKVLLVIAGADGDVSQAKFDWLVRHQRKFGASDEVIAQYRDFDFRNADLAALLGDISVDVPTWSAPPHLIYHAVHMCHADGGFTERERAKVDSAAEQMGIPRDIVRTIYALVDLERSVVDMRKALFHINTL